MHRDISSEVLPRHTSQFHTTAIQFFLILFLSYGCAATQNNSASQRSSSPPAPVVVEKIATAKTIQTDPTAALTKLVATLPSGKVLAFTGISGVDGEKTELSDIAYFKLEPILINLCRDKGITLIERDKLQMILNEWKLEMNGLTKSDQGARELLGADIILTGKAKIALGNVYLFLKTINLQDGAILAAAEAWQSAEQYGKAAIEEMGGKTKTAESPPISSKGNHSASTDGKVRLWTEANSYVIGEKITVFFDVSEAAYVTIVDITPDGGKTILFPNSYQTNNFCKPGTVYQIPPPDAPFALEVTEPAGKDRIMAMTSAKPEVDQSMVKTRGLKFTDAIVSTTNSRASITFDIK